MRLLLFILCVATFATACSPVPSPEAGGDSFAFTYSVHNGLDCHMMNDCGYSFVLTEDKTLAHLNDQGETIRSTSVSLEALETLSSILRDGGYFEFPTVLPDIPEENIPRGGRTITMSHVHGDGETTVTAYPDVTVSPVPDQFLVLDEQIQTYLSSLLGIQ